MLSADDLETYREIFAAQDRGNFAAAEKAARRLQDRLLMGHVLAQRYLEKGSKLAYADLKTWLDAFADHPDAKRIYEQARKLKPKGVAAPRRPEGGYLQGSGWIPSDVRVPTIKRLTLPKAQARQADRLRAKFRQAARQGSTATARKLLDSSEAERLLSRDERDSLATELALFQFQEGDDAAAYEIATAAAKRSGNLFMEAHWTAGLAAWRLGRYADSASHFEAVATHRYSSSWMASAGSFWAARARLAARQPEQVNRHLEAAARYPRTFYGLLALQILDLPMPFKWETPGCDTDDVARLAEEPAGRRALALIQVGEEERAERELRVMAASADGTLLRGALAVAAQVNMPALATRLDSMLAPRGEGFDGAAFPVPSWEPEGGYTVDRALVFALIRQESGFNPNALSHAGATGLMQLMPGTASFVAGDGIYRRSGRKQLHDPDLNLRLGQKYMEMLLADDPVNGDLFLLAAAWNGGPGNLKKWLRASRGDGDPLMFIETIPMRETRIFVERVLANFWIYQHRLGQESPSLTSVAAGAWPAYMPQDPPSTLMARNVKD